jgi:predicted nucleic acid-binding protein
MSMIVDSNVVIYSILPDMLSIREFLRDHQPAVSAITMVEVLGFHRLVPEDRTQFEAYFGVTDILPLDRPVLDRAVALRQQRQMGLADSLIAATALVHGLTLVTRNVADFAWVPGLQVLNPLPTP